MEIRLTWKEYVLNLILRYNKHMRKILIYGLGAVGLTYAVKFKANSELKILVDKERLKRYICNLMSSLVCTESVLFL